MARKKRRWKRHSSVDEHFQFLIWIGLGLLALGFFANQTKGSWSILLTIIIVAIVIAVWVRYFRKVYKENLLKSYRTLSALRKIEPRVFEETVAYNLKKVGYEDVIVTRASKDGGLDIQARWESTPCIFSCKRYSDKTKVKIHEVRAMRGIAAQRGPDTVAIIVTTWSLTKDAMKEAEVYGVGVWDQTNILKKLGLE